MATRPLPLLAVSALTLAGTALTAAAAYRYGLQHAHQHRSRRPAEPETRAIAMSSTATTTTATAKAVEKTKSETPSRLALLTTMLLQDASLLVIAMGIATMGLALGISLTLVATSADVMSLDDLPMFSSLMTIGAGMVVVGLLNAMLQYSNRKRNAAPGEIVLPPGHPPIPMETLKEMVELDEDGKPKQRISKCPFGF